MIAWSEVASCGDRYLVLRQYSIPPPGRRGGAGFFAVQYNIKVFFKVLFTQVRCSALREDLDDDAGTLRVFDMI